MVASVSGILNLYLVGRRYFSSSAGLFKVAMTIGLEKWVLGSSWIS